MRTKKRVITILLTVFGLAIVLAGVPPGQRVNAGGPLLVTPSGRPYTWARRDRTYTPDQGRLGRLSNSDAVALVTAAFQVWGEVPTARIQFSQAGQLSQDVTHLNFMSFINQLANAWLGSQGRDCVRPIIFDTDGRIIDAVAGPGASQNILGFTSRLVIDLNGFYLQSYVVLNGRRPPGEIRGTAVHEFGHLLGLDHSQLNSAAGLDFDTRNDDIVPTMFPFLVTGAETLRLDDMVSISSIYPNVEFFSRGKISGHVLFPNGRGFQGANVIARKVDDPELTAVSIVSGYLHAGTAAGGDFGSNDPELLGSYDLAGLPNGRYTVEIEEIRPFFTEGSSVGPLDPPARLPGPPEFYSGEAESATDDPASRVEIEIDSTNRSIRDIDIILNTTQLASQAELSPRVKGRMWAKGRSQARWSP